MSFGGGGFGGFGSTNNQNQSAGFGSGGGFGTGTNNNTSSGFGSNTNANTTFGSKPFGSGSTGGLFGGGSTSGATFGGFGSTANNTTATSTFGSGGAGGGLFGQNKPATTFGSGGTTGGSLFGGGGSTGGGFGQTNTTGGFGTSATSSPFGANNQPQQQQQLQQQQQQNQPNNGTASTPFSAVNEKDASGQQQYQTITFQQPYMGYSLEELRLVDYNQGRRYGNSNGQAGAFGQSTGFGGFGSTQNAPTSFGSGANTNTGSGLFGGSGTGTGTTFGQGNTTTTFGSTPANTGGGLFGANKPGGGLFGSTSTSQPASGGLFGSSNTNTGGFGSGNTGTGFGSSTTGGGGLFGQQNQTQAKPGFGFGANTTTNTNTGGGGLFGGGSTGGGFGQPNTSTGGGLFGQQNQSSAPAFGAAQPTTGTTGGLFGGGGSSFGQNQTQTQNQPSGGLFGSGFGQNNQNQQKPAGGLFGSTGTGNTGGGLFGNNTQNQQTGGGLFGNTSTQNQTGGLFGAKPATGGGLFGSTNNNAGASTGGGLFGNIGQNNQQSSGTGLFGQSNQQKPAGGLFGSSQPAPSTGGGLFGNLNTGTNNNAGGLGGSLFGGSQTQQQPQQQPLNNSLFGASGGSLLNTSMNTNPYGNDALFAGLATPSQSPGPLATPLSSSQKNRKSAILPQHKLNPSASTRLLTPQNRKIGGYGFTYSTYGTPSSASSASSPGYSSNFFSPGSLTRSLGKSLSTSNLRNSFTPDTSILAPGAFSTNGRSFAGGSLKKLNINRNINTRVPLFDEPTPATKRVSFAGPSNGNDSAPTNGVTVNGTTDTQIVLRDGAEDEVPGEGSSRTSSTVNGEVNGATPTPRRPEMTQVNGGDLTPVPEQNALGPRSTSSLNAQQGPPDEDPTPGAYWSQPSMDQLRKMSPDQLKSVPNFEVGRQKVGKIEFNHGRPVDLTGINLGKLFGDIIVLNHRNASVYSSACTEPKIPNGTKINVPSRVILENSWPRRAKSERFKKGGLSQHKHVERLKRVGGTSFEQYDPESGVWIFTVPHFSSYGYDEDEEDNESSELSPPPDTPAQPTSSRVSSSQLTGTPQDDSPISLTQSSPDDTFDFKKGKRKRASVPGGFGDEVAYEEEGDGDVSMNTAGQSFLGQRSVGSLDGQHDNDYHEESESGSVVEQNMAGSVSEPVRTTGPFTAKEADSFKDSIKPKSILKASQPLRPAFGTPSKGQLVFDDDWANQLQRTISPRKQDRQTLRETQGDALRERDVNETKLAQTFNGSVIATKMDLMNSLFGTSGKGKDLAKKRMGTGIELPYAKRPKSSNDLNDLSEADRTFHSCNKPHFSETGILIYANHGPGDLEDGSFKTALHPIVGAHQDIRFARLPAFLDASPITLQPQQEYTKFAIEHGAPIAAIGSYAKKDTESLNFHAVAEVVDITTVFGHHEKQVWDLLAILFDENDQPPPDLSTQLIAQYKERFRKDKLSEFWRELVSADSQQHAQEARTAEEKAIAFLSGYNVPDACHALLNGMDLRLSTMVSQIPGDLVMRRDMISQIEEWRQLDVLSEMDESVRALYELLAGNCAQSDGKGEGGRENKASTFHIAERFGLDWRRAFGLRLWYGTLVDEPIEMAVAQFADALRDGKEHIKPKPWFIEEGVDMGWTDKQAEQREDILWGVLKLYASSKMELPVNIEEVIAPENVSGHPLHARLSWQLFQLFKSRYDDGEEADERRVGLPALRSGDAEQSFVSSTSSQAGDEQAEDPLVELGDKLTLTYAASLHSAEHWTTAAYVYTHLSSAGMREHYLRSLLVQFSKIYTIAEDDKTYSYLRELRIPETWMHAAAALQAKTEGDDVRQTLHLIKAEELEEAHEVLCRSVGPNAIIARDYDALRELLGDFVPTPTSTPVSSQRRAARPKDPVPGWAQGGQIYFDYIHLLDLASTRDTTHRVDEELNKEISALVMKLQHALESLSRDRWDQRGLEERVALSEIAGFVAGLVAKGKHSERARVLKLPLTEDLWLRHTTNLSSDYYRAVVAGAK
ncbi:nuclear protein 96-domain-containing protein [Lophiotrema nucula]|uniref:Nuclear protein 96-domain-containing protein n=1 Tax=Lophiotrema nucula TaxID=690887 RepID=A0A6A5ZD01_9PLEO|nr:nuclear protein 96-domain-containing protein [Lophiotrema nucula]